MNTFPFSHTIPQENDHDIRRIIRIYTESLYLVFWLSYICAYIYDICRLLYRHLDAVFDWRKRQLGHQQGNELCSLNDPVL